jgi:hypothetical protein
MRARACACELKNYSFRIVDNSFVFFYLFLVNIIVENALNIKVTLLEGIIVLDMLGTLFRYFNQFCIKFVKKNCPNV